MRTRVSLSKILALVGGAGLVLMTSCCCLGAAFDAFASGVAAEASARASTTRPIEEPVRTEAPPLSADVPERGALLARLRTSVDAGERMAPLREGRATPECIDRMHHHQALLRAIGSDARAAGHEDLARLSGVALNCASCMPDAQEWCDDARWTLDTLERTGRLLGHQ